MDISSGLMGTMFMVSNSLLYPVIIILLGLVAWSLVSLGQFVSEYAARSRDIKKLRVGCRDAKSYMQKGENKKAVEALKTSGSNDFLRQFINELVVSLTESKFAVEAEKLLQDYELKITAELEKARLVVKLGPMFGLMGTLIPLGPAILLVKKRWYTQDLSDMEYVVEELK
jgi:biopolymer transport protein ExbB/TolQ